MRGIEVKQYRTARSREAAGSADAAQAVIDVAEGQEAAVRHSRLISDRAREVDRCQIASNSDPFSRPKPTPCRRANACAEVARTGVAEPHIAEQSRSWRAVNGSGWL